MIGHTTVTTDGAAVTTNSNRAQEQAEPGPWLGAFEIFTLHGFYDVTLTSAQHHLYIVAEAFVVVLILVS